MIFFTHFLYRWDAADALRFFFSRIKMICVTKNFRGSIRAFVGSKNVSEIFTSFRHFSCFAGISYKVIKVSMQFTLLSYEWGFIYNKKTDSEDIMQTWVDSRPGQPNKYIDYSVLENSSSYKYFNFELFAQARIMRRGQNFCFKCTGEADHQLWRNILLSTNVHTILHQLRCI